MVRRLRLGRTRRLNQWWPVRTGSVAAGMTLIMATKLERTIRREIIIDGEPYTVSISPDGLRLTKKRFRSGVEMSWKAIWTEGDRRDESPEEGGRG
jgi:hypothetical protein